MVDHVISRRNWIHDIADFYDDQVFRKSHPNVMNWPLVKDDFPVMIITLSYVFFINYLGPSIMRNRKPFDLRWIMVPYNIFLVVVNFYVFFGFARIRLSGAESAKCKTTYLAVDPIKDPQMYRMAEITWYFYITKYIELLDTVFFVLRKKDRQLSRLHKIHHSTVPFVVLLLLRSEPGGYNSFFPLANSFVHCVMYTYYGISALGDEVTIHLRFKRYVTMTQMIQFILVLYYFISRPFYGCNWSYAAGFGNLFIAGFFFVLFCNFYWHEYCKVKDDEVEQNGVLKHKRM